MAKARIASIRRSVGGWGREKFISFRLYLLIQNFLSQLLEALRSERWIPCEHLVEQASYCPPIHRLMEQSWFEVLLASSKPGTAGSDLIVSLPQEHLRSNILVRAAYGPCAIFTWLEFEGELDSTWINQTQN